jgi:DNA gyrase inhibitor GyrI
MKHRQARWALPACIEKYPPWEQRRNTFLHPMKRFKMPILLLVVLPVALAAFWLVSTSRAATETPDYKLIRTEGKFEIRDYPELTIATTPMEGDEMNRGFGQLFRFITGSNEGSEKIEMTSPVLIDTKKDKKTMSFIMPKKAVEKGVPKPSGNNVSLSKIEAARFAVLRFEGGRSNENEKAAMENLRAWLVTQNVIGKSEPIFAYYDPPWTPIPLRRNEVMIQIEKEKGNE